MKACFFKSPIRMLGTVSILLLQACAGAEIVAISAVGTNPISIGVTAMMSPVTAEAAGVHTGLFDGLQPPRGREEDYARLDAGARELSIILDVPVTRSDMMLLTVLNKHDRAGLREFARESGLTRTQVMDAVARLEKLHLIWLEHRVTESGPFTASLTPLGSFSSMPIAMTFLNRQFLGPDLRDAREIRLATAGSGSKEFN
ncbi:MAG: MarR family transcriptional regulator [Deltaproteobacteria bacterium]|nr:MarR family transcriptional regulator [Deltaproteobacteria bacterium]